MESADITKHKQLTFSSTVLTVAKLHSDTVTDSATCCVSMFTPSLHYVNWEHSTYRIKEQRERCIKEAAIFVPRSDMLSYFKA